MPENISGRVSYDDLQHFAYLTENGDKSLLAVDVKPFNSLDPQDARYAYNYLKQKNIPKDGAINISAERKKINHYPVIVILKPF